MERTEPSTKWERFKKWSWLWLASRKTWISEVLSIAGPVLAGGAFSVDGVWVWTLLTSGAVAALSALVLRSANRSYRRQRDQELSEQQREAAWRLVYESNMAVKPILDGLQPACTLKAKRETLVSARSTIVHLAHGRLGPEGKISVNFFGVVAPGECVLKAESWGAVGRSEAPSLRVFTEDSASVKAALAGRARVEPDASDLPEDDQVTGEPVGSRYGSFAAAPVYAGGSLYGLLTVDSTQLNAFSDLHEEQLMNFGKLIALTFAAEGRKLHVPMLFGNAGATMDDEPQPTTGGDPA